MRRRFIQDVAETGTLGAKVSQIELTQSKQLSHCIRPLSLGLLQVSSLFHEQTSFLLSVFSHRGRTLTGRCFFCKEFLRGSLGSTSSRFRVTRCSRLTLLKSLFIQIHSRICGLARFGRGLGLPSIHWGGSRPKYWRGSTSFLFWWRRHFRQKL